MTDAEQGLQKYEQLLKIVDTIQSPRKKEPLQRLVEALGVRFCTAPASHMKDYHNCYPGGLFDHSILVTKYVTKLNEVFNSSYSRDSIITVGMFHDLGKIGNLESDYYVVEESSWHREKMGRMYNYNLNLDYLHHSERSAWLLNHFSVELSEIETQAILYHDGLYIPKGELIKNKEDFLTLILHWADMTASLKEKEKIKKL